MARWRYPIKLGFPAIIRSRKLSHCGQAAAESNCTGANFAMRSLGSWGRSSPVRKSMVPLRTFKSHGSLAKLFSLIAILESLSAKLIIALILLHDWDWRACVKKALFDCFEASTYRCLAVSLARR